MIVLDCHTLVRTGVEVAFRQQSPNAETCAMATSQDRSDKYFVCESNTRYEPLVGLPFRSSSSVR